MALPLPRVVSDVGPGGGLVTAMGGINALNNNMLLRKINEAKAQYAPLTTQAEAASKLAYANLMGPQFLAKLLGNDAAVANMGDAAAKNALQKAVNAGMGSGNTGNVFSGVGQPSTNSFSGYVKNAINGLLGKGQQLPMQNQNPIAGLMQQQNNSQPSQNAFNSQQTVSSSQEPVDNNEALTAYDAWMKSPEGQKELSKGEKANIPDEIGIVDWYRNKTGQQPMEMTLNKGNRHPSYAEKTGEYKGIVNQGSEAGKLRAKDIDEIGKQQLQLSNTGSNLDRLIDDFTNPDFMALRDQIPFFQDMQLKAAAHLGTKEQQDMIGNIIADLESFKGSTINTFKGQTLKREFDYADKLKPSDTDTVYTALGKLRALKNLKEIAYKKNSIINKFMQKDKMSLSDAVEKADKMIDVKKIDKEVKDLTQPMITVRNKKTGNYMSFTKARAKEMGLKI